MKERYCRVCGLYNEDFPWGEDGKSPNYDYCFCCGVEFGNQDYTLESIRQYRENWLKNGAQWDEPSKKPEKWNLEVQLKQIPKEFYE